jgi:hypothetical protein
MLHILHEPGEYVDTGTSKKGKGDAIMRSCSVGQISRTGMRRLMTGNDGLYGGLGGDYTVITASEINGPLVLRHELGHSLIDEGDEYDGSM